MQTFLDNILYKLFIFTITFGVIFHDVIGFKSIDEICGLCLFIIFLFSLFQSKDWNINKVFLFTLFVFSFYLCYSLWISSNSKKGILMDLVIQMKPYLAFFCMYQLKPKFSDNLRLLLKQLMLLFWFILLPIGLIDIIIPHTISAIMVHPTYFAGAITAISLTYLYASDYTKKDKIIFLAMLTIGLVSGRSKFYGFYALSTFVILYFENPNNLKLNIKNISILTCTTAIIIFVAREKLMLYFGQGIMNEEEGASIARFVLYATSLNIFIDYFPFGCGLGSFATHASGYYYSPIYAQYGIDQVWGISKNDWSFIADTYYPSLAQFGIIGVVLFISFWFYLLRKSYKIFSETQETKVFALVLLITGYCLIENIADASFTSNRGFFMLMFLGLILSNKIGPEAKTIQPVIK